MGIQYTSDVFIESAKKNDVVVVKLFLQAGMDPNSQSPSFNQTALQHAAGHGNLELVKELIERGASIEKAIRWAVIEKQNHIVDYMLKKNSSQEVIDMGLHAAVGRKTPELVRLFLDKGANLNFISYFWDIQIPDANTSVLFQTLVNPDIKKFTFCIQKAQMSILE